MERNQNEARTFNTYEGHGSTFPGFSQTPRFLGGTKKQDSTESTYNIEPLSTWYEAAKRPISVATAADYRKRYFMTIDRVALELDKDADSVSIEEIVEHLRSNTTLATSSKSTYRAAILWALKQLDLEFSAESRERGLRIVSGYDPRVDESQSIQVRRSRESARSIPEQDLGPLLDGLLSARCTKQNYAAKTTAWLMAGIATGARPGEWQTAYWLDRDRGVLRLPNAKLKNQAQFNWRHIPERLIKRADADLVAMAEIDLPNVPAVLEASRRHAELSRNLVFFDRAEARVDISDGMAIENLRRLRAWELHNAGLAWRDIEVPQRQRPAVDAHLENLRQYLSSGSGHTFERYYNGCRGTLPRACKHAFDDGRLYSLYDTRSTAAANLTAAFGSEIAANVLGHYMKRKRTIGKNYAGPQQAYSGAKRYAPRLVENNKEPDLDGIEEVGASPLDAIGEGGTPTDQDSDQPKFH